MIVSLNERRLRKIGVRLPLLCPRCGEEIELSNDDINLILEDAGIIEFMECSKCEREYTELVQLIMALEGSDV